MTIRTIRTEQNWAMPYGTVFIEPGLEVKFNESVKQLPNGRRDPLDPELWNRQYQPLFGDPRAIVSDKGEGKSQGRNCL